MNTVRKMLKIVLLALLSVAIFTVSAYAADFEDEAETLRELGLFIGSDEGFALDNAPTRVQMAVMTVRLLGAEKAAHTEKNAAPFSDVPEWASDYVGWLWAKKLTKGTDAEHFSPDLPCTAQMYSAVLLRALGYNESSGDFAYENAVDFALKKGVIDYVCWGEDGFLRDDMAAMSYWALDCRTAEGSSSLLTKLRDAGAVPAEESKNLQMEFFERQGRRQNISANLKNIKHAGGMIDGYTLTNSLEALDAAAEAGDTFIELDFCLTSDNHVVCLHHWDGNILSGGDGLPFPLSLSQFEACSIYGRFTPLTLDRLAQWLFLHPSVSIITDVKDCNFDVLKSVAAAYPDLLDRFVPQIYAQSEYCAIRALGYDNIIFTLYALPMSEKYDTGAIGAFAATHRLAAIAFDVSLAGEAYIAALSETGLPLFVHTVNDESEKEKMRALGIMGVYSDY